MAYLRQFEREPSLGGMPSEHDRAVVYSDHETTPHPLTGKPQPKALFWGTVATCAAWMREHPGAA